jgi:hypothetical protein
MSAFGGKADIREPFTVEGRYELLTRRLLGDHRLARMDESNGEFSGLPRELRTRDNIEPI